MRLGQTLRSAGRLYRKAARPLRLLASVAMSGRSFSRQVGSAVRRNGGAVGAVKKILHIGRRKGFGGYKALLRSVLAGSTPTVWYELYHRGADYQAIRWRGTTRFSVIMPIYRVQPRWLEEAVASVVRQTYPHWELICIDDHSQDEAVSAVLRRAAERDPRVRHIAMDRNEGVSRATNRGLDEAAGDYILLMDHDDVLERHALARLGDAAFAEDADILYGDEVVTGESVDTVLGVQARPIFSHIFYLSHPFIVHPWVVRTRIVRQVGGLDASLSICQDVDFVLRSLQVARRVTHVPDILYRWRTSASSVGHANKNSVMEVACRIKREHLNRLGFLEADVRPGISFNTFSVRYFAAPEGRILAIIPTKNHVALLRQCIETVRATTRNLDLSLLVVDHMSDDPETQRYLREIEAAEIACVLPYEGKFNYSAINNHAVAEGGTGYDYFLFLNNDIEATSPGWLDAMLDLASLADVGAVGATLLYPDGTVQHSGVIVGLCGSAEHAFKTLPWRPDDPGYLASLHATREYSAVTAACMLVPAEAFRAVGGYDERLEVGFNDTDLCLRIGQTGRRIVNCAEAVLIHHESASRGKRTDVIDVHPEDSALFCSRHASLIAAGDPHFSPLLADDNPTFILDVGARLEPTIRYETVTNVLPPGRRVSANRPGGG